MSDQSPPESENVQLPLISIIVDSYRNSDSLKYCLDSIKQQDYLQKLVIVIVNDGEKTSDLDYLKSYFTSPLIKDDKPAPLDVPNDIYKVNEGGINFGIISLLKNCWDSNKRRQIGINACYGYSAVFGFLNGNESYFDSTIISRAVIKFLESPEAIGLVVGDFLNIYYKENIENPTKKIPQIGKYNDSYFISKLFYEKIEKQLPNNNNLPQIVQRGIISTIPDICHNVFIKEKDYLI